MNLLYLLATLSLISAYVYLHIGIYTLRLNKESILNRVFFLLCFVYAIWAFAYSFAYTSDTIYEFSFWNKLSAFGWCTFSALSLYLVLLLTENRFAANKFITVLIFLPGAVFLYMALFLFGPDIETPVAVSNFFYVGDFLYNLLYTFTCIVLLIFWGINTESLRVKKQAKLLVISSSISFLLNLMTQTILPRLGYGPLPLMGQIYAVIMILGAYVVISKYKMLRIPMNIIVEAVENKIIELVILLNEKGEFIQISNHVLRLLGYEEKDLLGKNITSLFDEADREKFFVPLLKQEIEYSDIQIIKKNSERLPVQIMCVPLFDNILNEFLGTLLVVRDISKEYELRAINAELHERTIRDSLTNLYNHQHSLEILNHEINCLRSDSARYALTIMMLDLDHFKRINDSFGHLYGDYVLLTISEILTKNVGNQGHVGRFGGEEFMIILPGAGIAEAICIGEKIKNDICHYHYNDAGKVTVSIGIAQLAEESSLELLTKADDLLYKAKQNGRNRLEFS